MVDGLGWFGAAIAAMPALIAGLDRHRDLAELAAAAALLAVVGGLLDPSLGWALAGLAWAVALPLIARRNARRDMEMRHRLILQILKLRLGVSDAPSRQAAQDPARRAHLS